MKPEQIKTKVENFLTKKNWDKDNPIVGGALYIAITQLLSEFTSEISQKQEEKMKEAVELLKRANKYTPLTPLDVEPGKLHYAIIRFLKEHETKN